jgi:MYXO-CTERM domain-containing protein
MKSTEYLPKMGRRHSLPLWLVAGLSLFVAKNAVAAEYYVATTGSDSNPGTIDSPFATLQKANDSAAAGDTIWMRAGTYSSTSQITLSTSGTSDTNRTKIWAYTGEVPVLDFSNYALASEASDHPAITVTGSWMHLKGLEIANGKVGASGSHSYSMLRTSGTASNNTFELLNIHHGFGPGLFIDSTSGTGGNLILNCDSHDNYDVNGSQGDGQNGDGFGHHYQTTGTSSTFRGCRTWWNSDDGIDLISQEVPVTVENCWAFGMGTANYGTTTPSSGNGNGFKMGSSKTGIRHIVQNNVAWKCKASGFYANHSSGGNTWYNNTAFENGTNFNMLASTWSGPDGTGTRTDGVILTGSKVHIMRNNLAYPNTISYITGYGVDTAFNTWDLNITAKPSDFLSITDPSVGGTGASVETSGALGPRQADGSLPDVDFLKLAAGSQMIDKGTDVGLPYVGAAPDLGAYEYGATEADGGAGTGGATGAGGATGTGGASGTGGGSGSGGTTGGGGITGGGGRSAAGGTTVVGGAPGSGGRSGTGGGTAIGGAPGSGGTAVVGGAQGSGGIPAVGGEPGTGGAAATGGGTGTTGTGGVVGTGGTVGAGGSGVETGGSVTTGGAVGTGGLPASGGAASTSPVPSGGSPATGGVSGTGVTGGTTTVTGTAQASSGGCSCRITGNQNRSYPGLALLGLVMIALRLRKRR